MPLLRALILAFGKAVKGSFGGLFLLCRLVGGLLWGLAFAAAPAAAQDTFAIAATPLPKPYELPDGVTWAGGLALTSADPRLGGVSGMGVGLVPAETEGGVRMLAVTDSGSLLSGDLLFETEPSIMLTGLQPRTLRVEQLTDARTGLRARQAESLATWQQRLAFGFEANHRVGVMHRGTKISNLPVPVALRGLSAKKQGVEALATLPDGSLLAISEGVEREGGLRAWIYDGQDDDWRILVYEWDQSFAPTGADVTPDGRFLVVSERKFVSMREPLSNRLMVVPVEDITANSRLTPRKIIDLDPILGAVANVESVAILPTADPAEFLILVATDNNYITMLPTMIAALLWRP